MTGGTSVVVYVTTGFFLTIHYALYILPEKDHRVFLLLQTMYLSSKPQSYSVWFEREETS